MLKDDLTLIFVTLDRPHFFRQSLSSVKDFPKIIVYDNGTKNVTSRKIVEAQAKKAKAKYIYNSTNDGLPTAWNRCSIMADTDWVVQCPDDVIFRPGWLDSFNKILAEKPNVKFIAANNYDILVVHKSFMVLVGWWEERYRGGISSEDYDLHLRLSEKLGFSPYTMPGDHIQGIEREIRMRRKTTKEQFFDKDNFVYWCNSEFSSVPIFGDEIPHLKDGHWMPYLEPGAIPGFEFHKKKWVLCDEKDPGALLNIDGQFWKRLIPDVDPYPEVTAQYKEKYGVK